MVGLGNVELRKKVINPEGQDRLPGLWLKGVATMSTRLAKYV
jgi:hypothetical protein